MENNRTEKTATIKISGRIDSGNAAETENRINSELEGVNPERITVDAAELDYISSAGLRVILRLKKTHPDIEIVNVNPDVYEILEMTGFTEMMTVRKAYRVVSVEGCEVIGEGFNGKVYRIDKDNVVKTYKNADALAEIEHEREVARLALILGVPTAISYDIVRVGDSYGSVFELLNARSFAKILAEEPEKMDHCVEEYVKILKKIHSISVPEGKLPAFKKKAISTIRRSEEYLPREAFDKVYSMTEAVPDTNHMIHADCHAKNLVMTEDETLLIDMDTLSVGHPVFEFMQMYKAYIGFSEYDPEAVLRFMGFSSDVSRLFWNKTLRAYLGTENESSIRKIENKIRCMAYAYLIGWTFAHPNEDREIQEANRAIWKERLLEILPTVSDLSFDPSDATANQQNELDIEASDENLHTVIEFVNSQLEKTDCSPKALMQMDIAVEEIFINIARYAYAPDKGCATVRAEVSSEDPVTVTITFIDSGVPYDPLKKDDPDIKLSAGDREIGGLGIFMTKKVMDSISYEYRDGKNILTMKKNL